MNWFKLVVAAIPIVLLNTGWAQTVDGEAALKKSGCLACHSVSGERVGPSFKRIATRYKGQSGAAAMLQGELKRSTIKISGKDVRHAAFKGTDAELKSAVAYILKTPVE